MNSVKNQVIRTIAIFSVLILAACSQNKPQGQAAAAPQLPVLDIAATDAATTSEFPAAIQGSVDIEIRPQVTGTLDKIYVDEGAYVTKGQSLFKINDNTYRESVNDAEASLSAAEAAIVNAKLEVEKLTPLVANKVVSDYQLKSANAALKIANANAQQLRAKVASTKINYGYTIITAPVSGYIGLLHRKQGSQLSPADVEPLTTLSDVQEVNAYFSLGEADFINFKSQYEGNSLGDKLKKIPAVSLVLANDTEYSEKGKITMINGQFDKNTGSITMRATFPNSKGLLRSGNTGKIRLNLNHNDVITVPQEATIEIQDKIFVFTVGKDNKVTKQAITISGTSGTDYLVKEGIKSGDRIVYKGFENLQDGTVITPEKAQKDLAKN